MKFYFKFFQFMYEKFKFLSSSYHISDKTNELSNKFYTKLINKYCHYSIFNDKKILYLKFLHTNYLLKFIYYKTLILYK